MRRDKEKAEGDALLSTILGGFASELSRPVRRGEASASLARFTYAALLSSRPALAAAADEARSFVEGSAAAGKALGRIVAELRKELAAPVVAASEATIPELPDPRLRIQGAIRAADPSFLLPSAARLRQFPRKPRRSDFPEADPSAILSVGRLTFKGKDGKSRLDLLSGLDTAGLVAVAPDPGRRRSLLVAVEGPAAWARLRASPHFAAKRLRRMNGTSRRRAAEIIASRAPRPAVRPSSGPVASSVSGRGSSSGVRSRVRYPIGLKLILIISCVLSAALSGMIFLASFFFRQDARVRIEENNHQTAQVLGLKVGDDFRGLVSRMQFLLSLRDASYTENFFASAPEILFAVVPGKTEYLNAAKAGEWAFDRYSLERILALEAPALEKGKTIPAVINLSPHLGKPAVAVVAPYREGDFEGTLVVAIDAASAIAALQARGIGWSFVVNESGELILHPDARELSSRQDLSALPIVDRFLRSATDNGQTLYRDASGAEYLGAFRKTGFAGLGVVSVVPAALAFEAVDAIQRRNLYLMGAVLSLAMIVVWFYSRSITRPVGVLMDAAHRVEAGDFQLDIKPKTRDELGALTASFVEMGRGLGEREKIKEAFGKFVNKDIAERAMRNELSLGGERRIAAVFFSDIRGFTSISESLEPEEVVEFLNQYFTIMVSCVEKTGGVVDKFIGDAVMAVWGVPVSSGRDVAAAVDAALLMRASLADFNSRRGGPRKPVIRIGCAINAGPVLAGQIGSSKRMEYTVIGDTVNLSSRIESLTKPFGVDILVSDAVRLELAGAYVLETMQLVTVKGKSEPQHVYAVLGKAGDRAAPLSLAELRGRLGLKDFALDADSFADEEEKKYKIEGRA